MLKGGVIRVVVEDRNDGRIDPGVLVVEIFDSLVNNALLEIASCAACALIW